MRTYHLPSPEPSILCDFFLDSLHCFYFRIKGIDPARLSECLIQDLPAARELGFKHCPFSTILSFWVTGIIASQDGRWLEPECAKVPASWVRRTLPDSNDAYKHHL